MAVCPQNFINYNPDANYSTENCLPPEYPTDVCPTTSYQGQWSTNYVCDHPDYQEFCTDGYPDPNKGLFYNDLGSGV